MLSPKITTVILGDRMSQKFISVSHGLQILKFQLSAVKIVYFSLVSCRNRLFSVAKVVGQNEFSCRKCFHVQILKIVPVLIHTSNEPVVTVKRTSRC